MCEHSRVRANFSLSTVCLQYHDLNNQQDFLIIDNIYDVLHTMVKSPRDVTIDSVSTDEMYIEYDKIMI